MYITCPSLSGNAFKQKKILVVFRSTEGCFGQAYTLKKYTLSSLSITRATRITTWEMYIAFPSSQVTLSVEPANIY